MYECDSKRHRCCVVDQKPHIRYTLFKECNCSSVNCIAMIIRVRIGLVGAFIDEHPFSLQKILYIHQELFSDRNEGML